MKICRLYVLVMDTSHQFCKTEENQFCEILDFDEVFDDDDDGTKCETGQTCNSH